MNLFALLNKGAAHAPSDKDRRKARIDAAVESTRKRWLDALLIDQTRAWMSIGTKDVEVIEQFSVVLSLAAFTHVFDAKRGDSPELRIIRGAMSAAGQCIQKGGLISVDDARAFSVASSKAIVMIRDGSVEAILQAAKTMDQMVPA